MQRFLGILIFLLGICQTTFSQWFEQTSNTTSDLQKVSFINSDIGWIVGNDMYNNYSGIILKTTDRGSNWTQQIIGEYLVLNSICFTDTNNGAIVGSDLNSSMGILLKTTNGGLNWEQQTIDSTAYLNDVYFVDINNGWMIGTKFMSVNKLFFGQPMVA